MSAITNPNGCTDERYAPLAELLWDTWQHATTGPVPWKDVHPTIHNAMLAEAKAFCLWLGFPEGYIPTKGEVGTMLHDLGLLPVEA